MGVIMRRRACRSGSHAYGPPVRAGAGISRTVCKYCGAVEIDLRDSGVHALGPEHDSDARAASGSELEVIPHTNPTGADPVAVETSSDQREGALFRSTNRVSLFEIHLAVDAGLYELDATRPTRHTD